MRPAPRGRPRARRPRRAGGGAGRRAGEQAGRARVAFYLYRKVGYNQGAEGQTADPPASTTGPETPHAGSRKAGTDMPQTLNSDIARRTFAAVLARIEGHQDLSAEAG